MEDVDYIFGRLRYIITGYSLPLPGVARVYGTGILLALVILLLSRKLGEPLLLFPEADFVLDLVLDLLLLLPDPDLVLDILIPDADLFLVLVRLCEDDLDLVLDLDAIELDLDLEEDDNLDRDISPESSSSCAGRLEQ